jgi:hypothetical protein
VHDLVAHVDRRAVGLPLKRDVANSSRHMRAWRRR